MVSYRFVAMAGMAGMVAALPLNINLGAYSPALVVGDGEISFGGKADVSNLMNALEGAAVNAANGARPANGAAPAAPPAQPAAAPAAPAAAAAAVPAAGAALGSPAADPALQEQAQQIAALQGMGKSIAPRAEPEEADEEDEEESADITKRDLAGFDRALRFAEVALTKGPKIQMGTGEGGAGVGMIIDNNPTAAARPGKGEAEGGAREGKGKARKARRDVVGSNQKVKVTTMFIRSGIPASLQNSPELTRRNAPAAAAAAAAAAANPPSRSDALDAVNLNVDGDKGVTMTFVETVDVDDE